MSTPPLRVDAHRERAARHLRVGCAIEEVGDEWAAVCMFYAAYHLVKAAMLTDPVWSDPGALHRLHADLVDGDRFTTRHKGRRNAGAREWGVNELVSLLYPSIRRPYERLHQASIQVRYGAGLPAGALPDLRAAVDEIQSAYDLGALVAAT